MVQNLEKMSLIKRYGRPHVANTQVTARNYGGKIIKDDGGKRILNSYAA